MNTDRKQNNYMQYYPRAHESIERFATLFCQLSGCEEAMLSPVPHTPPEGFFEGNYTRVFFGHYPTMDAFLSGGYFDTKGRANDHTTRLLERASDGMPFATLFHVFLDMFCSGHEYKVHRADGVLEDFDFKKHFLDRDVGA